MPSQKREDHGAPAELQLVGLLLRGELHGVVSLVVVFVDEDGRSLSAYRADRHSELESSGAETVVVRLHCPKPPQRVYAQSLRSVQSFPLDARAH